MESEELILDEADWDELVTEVRISVMTGLRHHVCDFKFSSRLQSAGMSTIFCSLA